MTDDRPSTRPRSRASPEMTRLRSLSSDVGRMLEVAREHLGAPARIAAAAAAAERLRGGDGRAAVFIGFSRWKQDVMRRYFPDRECVFLAADAERITRREMAVVERFETPTVHVWSCRHPRHVEAYCAARGLTLYRVEDGFIRGVGLGLAKTAPLSLVFDATAAHFERARPSDLERLIAEHDFAADDVLMARARRLLARVVGGNISKYNFSDAATSLRELLPDDGRRRILVLGQVEADMSIRHGMRRPATNAEVVRRTMEEAGDAVVLFRPHPEMLRSQRRGRGTLADLPEGCVVLPVEAPLEDCFAVADRVVTMTSLAGFEAALRGLPVVTLGGPFYAGWGFTEDRDPIARRTRRLTPLEVFAAAYLLYPRYFDPDTGAPIDAEAAVDILERRLADLRGTAARDRDPTRPAS